MWLIASAKGKIFTQHLVLKSSARRDKTGDKRHGVASAQGSVLCKEINPVQGEIRVGDKRHGVAVAQVSVLCKER